MVQVGPACRVYHWYMAVLRVAPFTGQKWHIVHKAVLQGVSYLFGIYTGAGLHRLAGLQHGFELRAQQSVSVLGLHAACRIHIGRKRKFFVCSYFLCTHFARPHSAVQCQLVLVFMLVLHQEGSSSIPIQHRPGKQIVLRYQANTPKLQCYCACSLCRAYLIQVKVIGIAHTVAIARLVAYRTQEGVICVLHLAIPRQQPQRCYQLIIPQPRPQVAVIPVKPHLGICLGKLVYVIALQRYTHPLKMAANGHYQARVCSPPITM